MSGTETYPMPKDGWVCWHCGERFMTPGRARDHFGERPNEIPGCILKIECENEKVWLKKIRNLEEAWTRMRIKLLELTLENHKLKAKL